MKAYKGALKKAFYDANSPECDFRNSIFKPAVAFEVFNNVSGIAAYYDFPDGMNPTEYEEALLEKPFLSHRAKLHQMIMERDAEWQKQYGRVADTVEFKSIKQQAQQDLGRPSEAVLSAIKEEWETLTSLNPSLGDIKMAQDSYDDLAEALFGVASLFAPQDIEHFIEKIQNGGLPGDDSRCDPVYAQKMNDIEKKYGLFAIQWVPSPQTLDKMHKAVVRKPGNNL